MNYIELKKRLPSRKYKHFLFADDKECSANSVFMRHKLYIKIREIAVRPEDKYQLVFCDIKKEDVNRFEEAMKSLKDKMLLVGKTDYEVYCKETFDALTKDEAK